MNCFREVELLVLSDDIYNSVCLYPICLNSDRTLSFVGPLSNELILIGFRMNHSSVLNHVANQNSSYQEPKIVHIKIIVVDDISRMSISNRMIYELVKLYPSNKVHCKKD